MYAQASKAPQPSARWPCFVGLLITGASGIALVLLPALSPQELQNLTGAGTRLRQNAIGREQEWRKAPGAGTRDLVLVHVPYNFGHTVEKVAAFGSGRRAADKWKRLPQVRSSKASKLRSLLQKGAEVWGIVDPALVVTSSVGCPLYLTPQKHWPADVARAYFGNRTAFGIIRDPYERLVALFRGSAGGETGAAYGGDYSRWAPTCDVDGAVRHMMAEYMGGNTFAHGCTLLPQSEYFEGDFGVQLAVDNREFPRSMNALLREHGYDFAIRTEDILHVTGCPEVWSAALAPDTRALVREVYKDDFDLLCARFGYCNRDESTCLRLVPQMCPRNMTEAG